MANIQTIRLVYHTSFLSEKEYIKAFLEFIGFQILEEACQSQDELNKALKTAAPSYDVDIWLNCELFNINNSYDKKVWTSEAKTVIALDYFFTKEKNSKEFSVITFFKKSYILYDKIFENVQTKEELRRKVLEKLVEQLWYGDIEKQEEMKFILELYLKHNIFVCLQSLTSLSLAKLDSNAFGIDLCSSEFWEFCINGFVDFFNELQAVSQSLKTVYALYAFVNTAIICRELYSPTWKFFDNNRITIIYNLCKDSTMHFIKKMKNMDENFIGLWCLASRNAILSKDTDFAMREYISHIICNIRGKGLNDDRFVSKYYSMLGDYYFVIGGNLSAAYQSYKIALVLNQKNIWANFRLALLYAGDGNYSEAKYRLLMVLELLGLPKGQFTFISLERTTDYEIFFITCRLFARIYFNQKEFGNMFEYIYYALNVVICYKECPWISKIVDDEPIWKMLQEHYKNGAPTCNLCNILVQWKDILKLYVNDDSFYNLLKSITPPKDNNPIYRYY